LNVGTAIKEFPLDLGSITTPALLVDLDAMESNLQQMAGFFADKRCKLRPHFKNHKAPILAWKQLRAGAIGITCATLREAEILVHHGVDSILIANEIAGDLKAERLADISRHASIVVAVDNCSTIKDLGHAQRNRNSQIQVVVDIDIGLKRCGVAPGEAALNLAKCAVSDGLKVRGVMGYDGHFQPVPPSPERDEQVRAGSRSLVDSAALLEAADIPVSIVSTGGTGTYFVSGVYPGITDIQAGSYLLMDTLYVERGSSFRRSLTVLATVISTRGRQHAVIDCGVKAISGERGLSEIKNVPGVRLAALHAEHGLLELSGDSKDTLQIGQKIELWVRYSDATVNLHSSLYGVRHGQVEDVYQIEH
jgi:D-serine deaminase-like pyridoxal phosphate-dependent protein